MLWQYFHGLLDFVDYATISDSRKHLNVLNFRETIEFFYVV